MLHCKLKKMSLNKFVFLAENKDQYQTHLQNLTFILAFLVKQEAS